jgi:hypothetical protein
LRSTIQTKRPECAFIRRFLDIAGASVQEQPSNALPRLTADEANRAPIVVGTLFLARRVVSLSSSTKKDAKASIGITEAILARFGLSGSFSAKADVSSDERTKVELDGKDAVPVAFSPAYKVVRSENPTVTLYGYEDGSARLAQELARGDDPGLNLTSSNLDEPRHGGDAYGYLIDSGVDEKRLQEFAKAAFGAVIRQ